MDDIGSWLKKVERATDNALNATSSSGSRLHQVDDVHKEASGLISDWMHSKLLDFNVNESTDIYEPISSRSNSSVVKEWDHLKYKDNVEDLADDGSDLVSNVDSFVKSLLDKDYVTKRQIEQIEGPSVNVPLKMELRHQQVKENREKRQKMLEQKRRKDLEAKETLAQAKKMLQKEEKEKQIQQKKEEELLQNEMTRIRKELAEKQKQEAVRQREEILRLKQESHLQELAELENRWKKERELERVKQRQVKKEIFISKMEHKRAVANSALMSHCFRVWFSLIAKQHVALGKAKAFFDYRLLSTVFRSWRSYAIGETLRRHSEKVQRQIREEQQRNDWAANYHRLKILKTYFDGWMRFIQLQRLARDEVEKQKGLQFKMQNFLEIASKKSEVFQQNVDNIVSTRASLSEINDAQQTKMDDSPVKSKNSVKDVKILKSAGIPKEPWQVTKDAVQLDLSDIEANDVVVTGESVRTKSSLKRSTRAVPVVNNFEHRHKAQQVILKSQAKQLAEQKRMIEELQSVAKQKELQSQLHFPDPVSPKSTIVDDELFAGETVLIAPQLSDRSDDPPAVLPGSDKPSSIVGPSQSNKKDVFLSRMEARAAERNRAKAEREAKRKREEEQRIRKAELEADQILQQEKEEKRKKMMERQQKEKKRLEQLELQRKEDQFVYDANYRRLTTYYGILPWKQMILRLRNHLDKAVNHYNQTLQRKCFLSWHISVSETVNHNRQLADQYHRDLLLRRYFVQWTMIRHQSELLEDRAIKFHMFKLMSSHFYAWQAATAESHLAYRQAYILAEEHDKRRLMLWSFRSWRRWPEERRAQKQKQARLDDWRLKVKSLLPDFSSATSSSSVVASVDTNDI